MSGYLSECGLSVDCAYTAGVGILRHLFVAIVIGVVLRWFWKSAINERASVESDRIVFPATRAIRIVIVLLVVAFATLFIWSWFGALKPDERWVPYLFLVLLALILFAYPRALSIEVDGIGSRSRLGSEKKIRWEDVAGLRYNTGNNVFTVSSNDGRKITHAGLNADPARFQHEIHKRTRLPITVTHPGTWKSETFEVSYEEVEAEEE